MTKAKNPIPEGLHSLTPQLVVKGASQAIDFYKKAFGAVEKVRMPGPNGKIMHAQLKIGDSSLFVNDEMPGMEGDVSAGGSSVVLTLYVPDCDATFKQAVAAGAKVTMPLADQFWGDRYGHLKDPYGQIWAIGTHKEDLTPAEMEERGRQAMADMGRR